MTELPPNKAHATAGRIAAIDIARGVALIAMAIYHFAWDLEFFGYAPAAMTAVGGWKLFARCIASSFLFLVGVSLVLGHANGIRWRSFGRRLAMVGGAAAAITIVTYFAVPNGFIFFGILHQIALASVLGLAFLRLPAAVTLLAAAAVIAAPHYLRSEAFDQPWLWWVGLSANSPRSNDYVPLFPWFGAVLAGIGLAKIAVSNGIAARAAAWTMPRWSRPLDLAGRHSLAFYLIHQPLLIGCVWLAAQIVPPSEETRQVRFLQSCEATCGETRDTTFCARYCVCVLDALERDNTIEGIYAGERSEALRAKVEAVANQCTIETDDAMLEGGDQ